MDGQAVEPATRAFVCVESSVCVKMPHDARLVTRRSEEVHTHRLQRSDEAAVPVEATYAVERAHVPHLDAIGWALLVDTDDNTNETVLH